MPSVDLSKLTFRLVANEKEVRDAHLIEETGYPADEAASLSAMLYRFQTAPELFLGAFDADGIVGYIMSTRSSLPLVTHEAMERSDPKGQTVCIHSVCTRQDWQHKGLATQLLLKYTELARELGNVSRLAMMSRENLVGFYERVGYKCLGPSDVQHGEEKWYDCIIVL
ncbi:hypothetical protein EC988_001902 [Linderina pennispora]|nr:hypothetical protein EC988_001902 [Linderina pennispora]